MPIYKTEKDEDLILTERHLDYTGDIIEGVVYFCVPVSLINSSGIAGIITDHPSSEDWSVDPPEPVRMCAYSQVSGKLMAYGSLAKVFPRQNGAYTYNRHVWRFEKTLTLSGIDEFCPSLVFALTRGSGLILDLNLLIQYGELPTREEPTGTMPPDTWFHDNIQAMNMCLGSVSIRNGDEMRPVPFTVYSGVVVPERDDECRHDSKLPHIAFPEAIYPDGGDTEEDFYELSGWVFENTYPRGTNDTGEYNAYSIISVGERNNKIDIRNAARVGVLVREGGFSELQNGYIASSAVVQEDPAAIWESVVNGEYPDLRRSEGWKILWKFQMPSNWVWLNSPDGYKCPRPNDDTYVLCGKVDNAGRLDIKFGNYIDDWYNSKTQRVGTYIRRCDYAGPRMTVGESPGLYWLGEEESKQKMMLNGKLSPEEAPILYAGEFYMKSSYNLKYHLTTHYYLETEGGGKEITKDEERDFTSPRNQYSPVWNLFVSMFDDGGIGLVAMKYTGVVGDSPGPCPESYLDLPPINRRIYTSWKTTTFHDNPDAEQPSESACYNVPSPTWMAQNSDPRTKEPEPKTFKFPLARLSRGGMITLFNNRNRLRAGWFDNKQSLEYVWVQNEDGSWVYTSQDTAGTTFKPANRCLWLRDTIGRATAYIPIVYRAYLNTVGIAYLRFSLGSAGRCLEFLPLEFTTYGMPDEAGTDDETGNFSSKPYLINTKTYIDVDAGNLECYVKEGDKEADNDSGAGGGASGPNTDTEEDPDGGLERRIIYVAGNGVTVSGSSSGGSETTWTIGFKPFSIFSQIPAHLSATLSVSPTNCGGSNFSRPATGNSMLVAISQSSTGVAVKWSNQGTPSGSERVTINQTKQLQGKLYCEWNVQYTVKSTSEHIFPAGTPCNFVKATLMRSTTDKKRHTSWYRLDVKNMRELAKNFLLSRAGIASTISGDPAGGVTATNDGSITNATVRLESGTLTPDTSAIGTSFIPAPNIVKTSYKVVGGKSESSIYVSGSSEWNEGPNESPTRRHASIHDYINIRIRGEKS